MGSSVATDLFARSRGQICSKYCCQLLKCFLINLQVLKRVMQLTGVRIPDSDINSITTVQSLLSHLITPPKATKVIQALAQKESLVNLPNVKIFGRRVTPIDKEVNVGRWKVI